MQHRDRDAFPNILRVLCSDLLRKLLVDKEKITACQIGDGIEQTVRLRRTEIAEQRRKGDGLHGREPFTVQQTRGKGIRVRKCAAGDTCGIHIRREADDLDVNARVPLLEALALLPQKLRPAALKGLERGDVPDLDHAVPVRLLGLEQPRHRIVGERAKQRLWRQQQKQEQQQRADGAKNTQEIPPPCIYPYEPVHTFYESDKATALSPQEETEEKKNQ